MQACCDQTLARMKRKYGMEEMVFRESGQSRSLCVWADLMVGFPGETESDFEETCVQFLDLPFSYCHVFTFSEREERRRPRWTSMFQLSKGAAQCPFAPTLASKRMNFHENQLVRFFEFYSRIPRMGFIQGTPIIMCVLSFPRCRIGKSNGSDQMKASPEFIEGELCLMRVIAKDKIEFSRLGFALAHSS